MLSIFDIFKIGLGPSSSHTVGPMKAAADFADCLTRTGNAAQVSRIAVEVYGSLALTGQGHGTFDALLLGLEGSLPHDIDLESIAARLERINRHAELQLNGSFPITFEVARDMVVRYDDSLPKHPNGLRFTAYNAAEHTLHEQIYYSVGGGFIVTDEEFGKLPENTAAVPYPFRNMAELQQMCQHTGLNIAQIVVANEKALSGEKELAVRRRVSAIAQAMSDCVQRGLLQRGQLPGGLNVRRRAPDLAEKMQALRDAGQLNTQLWPMIYAMAVNEENAAGGRVVTAPTNGAAGIVPAVLHYFRTFHPLSSPRAVEDFLLTAGAIGILYKTNASISGAEVGCQGEVGVACSMAAGAFAAVSGGSPEQVENAAEMAMEHHLGLTCDPVGGLVQIPCIERNGIAAEKAIKLAQLSLLEDGTDKKVSLDMVIQTMLQTGRDMKSTYKETSLAGLAYTLKQKAVPVSVRVVEC
ncbi:L-serine ammonia-lyase [Conchiformibius steedae DSM 2580]|uniref:L-serine dehydratase n=1 Tax=Conchiformibius steedae DSM 2580 TaxID=1121352 RepID=A0AAE9HX88_9NEIS|nr:L-serine ammonia-lyase [Conchiformibius steedae]QMT33682.1 L-serine ammonia-lyase [Conchiformibius steedae]URD68343.1 L-serine ammonia-lyase [Conchiformibius steedae DSM 2580]